jgi:hypothetical protein
MFQSWGIVNVVMIFLVPAKTGEEFRDQLSADQLSQIKFYSVELVVRLVAYKCRNFNFFSRQLVLFYVVYGLHMFPMCATALN